MQVGERLDVFEVLPDNWYTNLKTGDWVSEKPNSSFHGNVFGVDINISIFEGGTFCHLGLDYRNEARKVGTLIIKSIK